VSLGGSRARAGRMVLFMQSRRCFAPFHVSHLIFSSSPATFLLVGMHNRQHSLSALTEETSRPPGSSATSTGSASGYGRGHMKWSGQISRRWREGNGPRPSGPRIASITNVAIDRTCILKYFMQSQMLFSELNYQNTIKARIHYGHCIIRILLIVKIRSSNYVIRWNEPS